MFLYKTISKTAQWQLVVEKSKFIAHASRVFSREEAEEFIKSIKIKYKDASHNVPAFIIGNKQELMWTSDDGEPQGTSGPPILQLLEKQGLTNLVIVVTRYFGGIKLGTGGLVKAYSEAAQGVLNESGICSIIKGITLRCETDYSVFNKISCYTFDKPVSIDEVSYGENVSFSAKTDDEAEYYLVDTLKNISKGKLNIINRDEFLWEKEE